MNAVQSAVALPVSDPQDRLRVLESAAKIAAPINKTLARRYATEGVQVEGRIISTGQQPVVSVFSTGQVNCAAAKTFVQQVGSQSVLFAEQSLLAALNACEREVEDPLRIKALDGLQQNRLAARLMLALMERAGAKSAWTQEQFDKVFSNLPKVSGEEDLRLTDVAAIYETLAKSVSKDSARRAGLELLEWLGKQEEESDDRNRAISVAKAGLDEALGENAAKQALQSNVMAAQAAQNAQAPAEAPPSPEDAGMSVRAFGASGDQSANLRDMPAPQRAREAAALGFAAGSNKKADAANQYFDVAFSSLNDVWSDRGETANAADIVQEVSEAAAHVDSVNALQRAQRLDDPTAQAIGMLAVARVVMSQQVERETSASR